MKSSFSSSNGLLAGGSSQEAHDDEEDEVLSVDDEVLTDTRTPNRWEEEVEEVGVPRGGGWISGSFHGDFMEISWGFNGNIMGILWFIGDWMGLNGIISN